MTGDTDLLDRLQRNAFHYFPATTHPANGLVADTTRDNAPASIAVIGFALSSYPIAVEHGWLTREAAARITLTTLRWFWHSDQSGSPTSTGHRGFYFHFLDRTSGQRVWQCELSLIDTALLIAGALTAAAYFDQGGGDEAEIRQLAEALYTRIDWPWARTREGTLCHGWKPECGFLHYGWGGYSEAILLYLLALGSPTHPLPADGYAAWTATYQWENLYGRDLLYAGPLFIHQFSHAWIDFRGWRDAFMREKRSDYFENSRQAAYVQREYALRNPGEFPGYGADCWGLSAGDGPGGQQRLQVEGRERRFAAYAARGVPYGLDDGTVSPPALLASLPFAPEIVLPALRSLCRERPELLTPQGLVSGFNTALQQPDGRAWQSPGCFGLDQGIAVMMIENHRTQMIWRLLAGQPHIRRGLQRAGFRRSRH